MDKTNSFQEIMKTLVYGNKKYVEEHDDEFFDKLRDAQHPRLTLITCSDSRVQTTIFGIETTDEIFVIRNIGNQLMTTFGSIDYGVYHLKTPLLVILGHTHCGAIKAGMAPYKQETFDIIRELDHLSIPIKLAEENNINDTEKDWLNAVEVNVNYQVELAMKKYKSLIDKKELIVIGMIDDFLNIYEKGIGRVIINNINGETNPSKLSKHIIMNDIPEEIKEKYII